MQVTINKSILKRIIDGCANCIANDDRPILDYIYVKVESDCITAYGCDGYQASKVVVNLSEPSTDTFDCFIKPIKIDKKGKPTVVLSLEDSIATVEMFTYCGKTKYSFEQPKGKYPDAEKWFENARQNKNDVYVSSPKMIRALKTISALSTNSDAPAHIQIADEKNIPIMINNYDNLGSIEIIVLTRRGE